MNQGAETPPAIPDYELVRRVGRGAYGDVWLGRSVTGAYRAVKLVSRGSFSSDRPYEREFNGILKFEPISRTHPGLVSILHVGRAPGGSGFYYVMEVADDLEAGPVIVPETYVPRTVGARLRRGRLPLAECVQVGLALADALRHLHAQGLIHRDIKPSNLIFVNGCPKLADIGLVTDLGEKATFVGTEGYIPPEGPGTASADLYSLGKVLYEMGTGQPCDQFPAVPADLLTWPDAARFPRFNAVVLRACDPEGSRRLASAAELHAALAALADAPATAPSHAGATPAAAQPQPARAVVLFQADDAGATRLACRLEQALQAAGYAVALDDGAGYGVSWARRLEAQIGEAEAAVALLSPASLADPVFVYQLDRALRRIGPAAAPLVAVRVGFDGPLPAGLQAALGALTQLHWADEADDARLAAELVAALAPPRRPDAPTTPTP